MPSSTGVLTQQFLALAQDCLLLAETETGRRLAQTAFARSDMDPHLRGQSLLLMARLDVLDSQLVRAHRFSAMAVTAFQATGDIFQEAAALATLGYTASALKNDDEAITASERACVLVSEDSSMMPLADSLNYLGLAQMWAGQYDAALDTFEASIWHADDADRSAAGFQPMVNACITEVLKHHHDVHVEPSGEADLTRLLALTWKCQALRASGAIATLNNGTTGSGLMALLEFALAYAAAQRGHIESAMAHVKACRDSVSTWSSNTWLNALSWWGRFEIAMALGDLEQAQQCAWAMQTTARTGQQRPLRAVAARLAQHVEQQLLARRVAQACRS
jgi:tetratricopeptide (TPR) repeat protein